ncbi:hypothetical protein [Aeromicrobium sp. 9AM]|uniref:hypothetical protein n=1 Tax=Aeromicrobium sp. 9AM TaxID=2653126 RepID=UPI0012F0E2B7|nr:hypothetical protein [Aeromicrobium sp. 9AM]VXB37070.1 conserved membrane hypothetical protein [Aeromicrobium sp. 9AM]
MNPLGLAARIVAAVALLAALGATFIRKFLVLTIDIQGLAATSAGATPWRGTFGLLGCLVVAGGLLLAVVAAVLPTQLSVGRRLVSGLTSVSCVLAIAMFVLYRAYETNVAIENLDGLGLRFGWSAFVVFGLLVVGMVAGLVGAMLADRPTAPATSAASSRV